MAMQNCVIWKWNNFQQGEDDVRNILLTPLVSMYSQYSECNVEQIDHRTGEGLGFAMCLGEILSAVAVHKHILWPCYH